MKELIDKTEVINRLLEASEEMAKDTTDQFWLGISQGLQDAVSIIKGEFKPIDPVKHGEWVEIREDYLPKYYCSACGHIAYFDCDEERYIRFDYCPYCEAKMDV